jgi:hypothetical protein
MVRSTLNKIQVGGKKQSDGTQGGHTRAEAREDHSKTELLN